MAFDIFLSYSHKDRELADELRRALIQFGFKPFLAHQDISPSTQWKSELKAKLDRCRVVIPILTKRFRTSEWTDQEIGFALALDKKILPLKIHANPHGFLSDFQALKYVKGKPLSACWDMVEALSDIPGYRKLARDSAATFFLKSPDFETAARRSRKLAALRPFSAKQLASIIVGGTQNQNIYGCYGAQSAMHRLLADAKGKVESSLVKQYRQAVRNWSAR